MRYSASEKLEIIRLVERSHLPAKQTLDMLSIARTTFYRWYAHYRFDGEAALQDKAPLPARIWMHGFLSCLRDELLVLIRRITYRMPGQIEFKDPAPIGISYNGCIFRVRLAHVFCISNFFSNSWRFWTIFLFEMDMLNLRLMIRKPTSIVVYPFSCREGHILL